MIKLTNAQLIEKYEEAQELIAEQQMEIRDLKQELDGYCQGYEELLDKFTSLDIDPFN